MDTKYFKIPFAESGTRTAVPNVGPGDGSVGYDVGYGPDYSLDPGTDPSALLIDRAQDNQIKYDITDSVKALQEFADPQWITTADNGGTPFPYAAGARVLYTDGQIWQSLIDANTATPGTDAAKWIVFQSDQASNAALTAETNARIAADALLTPLAAFVQSLGAGAGSITFPGGLRVIWGRVSVVVASGAFANQAVTFAGLSVPQAAFASAIAGVLCQAESSINGTGSLGNNWTAIPHTRTVNGFTIRVDNEQGGSTPQSVPVFFVAVGF